MTTATAEHPVYTATLADRARMAEAPAYRDRPGSAVPWIDTADCAKLIRSRLTEAFPGVRFSVRLSRYAGGSSISIRYDGTQTDETGRPIYHRVDYDGNVIDPGPIAERDIDYRDAPGRLAPIPRPGMPTAREVKAIADAYGSARFDGMIDLGYSVSSWLLPDGRAAVAHSPGTQDSRGLDPAYYSDAPHPDAILVHLGAGYIHVEARP